MGWSSLGTVTGSPRQTQNASGLVLPRGSPSLICAVALFYRCLLTHQKVKAKPIPPNSTVKPDIPLTMVTHVPMAPATTNPQTHNETLTSLLISFIYGSDHWSRFASFGLIHITFKGHRCLTGGPCLMPYIRSSCRVSETSTHPLIGLIRRKEWQDLSQHLFRCFFG